MGESRNAYRVLVGRPEGKRPLGTPGRRWEDNIKMDLREVGYDDREWINLAQDRDRWRAYVRAAMNLRSIDILAYHSISGVSVSTCKWKSSVYQSNRDMEGLKRPQLEVSASITVVKSAYWEERIDRFPSNPRGGRVAAYFPNSKNPVSLTVSFRRSPGLWQLCNVETRGQDGIVRGVCVGSHKSRRKELGALYSAVRNSEAVYLIFYLDGLFLPFLWKHLLAVYWAGQGEDNGLTFVMCCWAAAKAKLKEVEAKEVELRVKVKKKAADAIKKSYYFPIPVKRTVISGIVLVTVDGGTDEDIKSRINKAKDVIMMTKVGETGHKSPASNLRGLRRHATALRNAAGSIPRGRRNFLIKFRRVYGTGAHPAS
ncbi:hypothetical protein ANN_17135 [Periplaneta americana]|uniref:Uncharacterized protein n=1 Tax=Periplaneta americana TaxID=6978 RepID=A0ABQ8SSP0_PERAM|nr:hypothetical protein ANN_17135 [Periplaneta americana]